IGAGQIASLNVVLSAGEARITLPSGKGGEVCTVYEAGADGNAAPVGRASGSAMSFILKAGLYDLECRGKTAPASAKKTQIRVVAGETQTTKIGD
ncbi:MAG: hypothetical protein HY765_10070, partial [Rhodomicrobium sp.]|nr:hypothetical protein [Rhodomicrobium sp.]